jgi:hypothetical protein
MREATRHLRARALGLLLAATACAQPYPTPTAVIIAFNLDGSPSGCEPLTGPIEARIGAPVPVSAACSEDRSGGWLVYAWSLTNAPAGARPTLANGDSITPTFVPDVAGTFRLQLVVSNGVVASAPAFADIAVGLCGGRHPAVAAGASNVSPHIAELVMLDAAVADEDTSESCAAHVAAYEYAWSLPELPPGSRAALNATTVRAPSLVVDVPGVYRARVVATDPSGKASQPSEIRIEASTCGGQPPVAAPITFAAVDAKTGEVLSLHTFVTDADTSLDCAVHAVSFDYAWSFEGLPPGSRATLNDGGLAEPSFTPDLAGTYSLKVVVTDPTGRQATAFGVVSVVAAPAAPAEPDCDALPVAAAVKLGPGATVACGGAIIPMNLRGESKILLDAAPSFDSDGEICGGLAQTLEYEWALFQTPRSGGESELESTNGRTTVLRVTSDGAYQVRLVVTDSTGLSSAEAICWIYAGHAG